MDSFSCKAILTAMVKGTESSMPMGPSTHPQKARDRNTTRTETRTEAGYEASKFGVSVVMGMSALIGIWGLACMIGGLASNGVGGMLKGYISAVTGM